jgi:hypothetical protein
MKNQKNPNKSVVEDIISREKDLVVTGKKLDKERPGLIAARDSY